MNLRSGCDTSSLRFPTKMLLSSIQSIFLFTIKLVRGLFCPITSTDETEISKESKNAAVVLCVCRLLGWKERIRAPRTFLFVKYNNISRSLCIRSVRMMDMDIGRPKRERFWNNFVSVRFSIIRVASTYTYKWIYKIKHKSQLIHAIMIEITELLAHFFWFFVQYSLW